MEKVVISDSPPASSFSEARLICRVCQKQFSQYTCPRCNTRYCSLECYKRHSLRCTESFMRENVTKELHQIQSNDDTKREMLEILKRVHSEDDINSDGEDGSILYQEAIQKTLSEDEIRLEDLSPDEIKKFRRAVASGELSKLIEPWDPWWKKSSAKFISLSPGGNQLVRLLPEEKNAECSPSSSDASICEVPAGPENPLPPVHQLSRTDPSPLLPVHLIDIIYSYCFTLRLYNGDRHFDTLGAAMVVLAISSVLGSDGRPETVSEALASCLEQTCSPSFRHVGGFKFGLIVINDIISLLSLGANAIICLLCDLRRLIHASESALKSEQMVKTKRAEISHKLKGVGRKVYYLTCWVHEQPAEAWPSLAGILEAERSFVSALGQVNRKHNKEDSEACSNPKLVEVSCPRPQKPSESLLSRLSRAFRYSHLLLITESCFFSMDAPEGNFIENNIAGPIDNAEKKDIEENVVAGEAEKRWAGWPGDSVFRLLVPAHKVGGIIGRKGESIKKMCEESKARIKILDGPPGAPERAVIISAKEDADLSISPAMDGLLKVHKRLIDGLDGDLNHVQPNSGNTVLTRLLVGATQAGSLIGKQGSTIKSIQETSNSAVRVVEDLPLVALPDDRVVEIQGEPTGVHRALELISNHLRKFLVDRSVIPLFEMHTPMQNLHMEHSMPPPQSWGHHQGLPPNAGGPGYGANSQYMPPRPHDNYYHQPDLPPLEKQPHHGISTYGRDGPSMGIHPVANQHPAPAMVSQVTQHMQIPLSYADAVIGAAGTNISYIRRASGATVTIQETRGVPGEMTVEIIGTATQVQTAQQLIQNFMAEAGAPAAAPPPTVMGQADQGYNSYPHGYMYSSPATNAGPPQHAGGGYSAYGSNYGY